MPNTRNCTNCNAIVPDGHHFCGRCGARFNEDGSTSKNDTLFFGAMQAPGRAKLILIKGEGLEGLSYHLNATEHVAGRKQGAILFPEDVFLSAKHATFRYRDNLLYLNDEGSHNGTFLRLREPTLLNDGDEIAIGEQILKIEFLAVKTEYPMREDTLMYVSPPKDYKFRVLQIGEKGKPGQAFCSVNNDILVGCEGADIIFPDDKYLSRNHVRLTFKDGHLICEDLNSKNGTFRRIRNEERILHGDYVSFGTEVMRIEINQ